MPWGPAQSIHGDVVGAIRATKAESSGEMVLFAGADLATSFVDAELVDEYRLMVHPIVLGKGIALFDRIHAEQALTLLDVTPFGSGVVELRYAPTSGL